MPKATSLIVQWPRCTCSFLAGTRCDWQLPEPCVRLPHIVPEASELHGVASEIIKQQVQLLLLTEREFMSQPWTL